MKNPGVTQNMTNLAKYVGSLIICSRNFPEYKFPEKNQTVDEQIMKFSGCVEFLQYNVQKPVRRGLKLWVRCNADSAYCQEFEVYLGAGSMCPL